jgi:hypothetical protein
VKLDDSAVAAIRRKVADGMWAERLTTDETCLRVYNMTRQVVADRAYAATESPSALSTLDAARDA